MLSDPSHGSNRNSSRRIWCRNKSCELSPRSVMQNDRWCPFAPITVLPAALNVLRSLGREQTLASKPLAIEGLVVGIAVIRTGALGCFFGGKLRAIGHDVWLLHHRQSAVDAMTRTGTISRFESTHRSSVLQDVRAERRIEIDGVERCTGQNRPRRAR
ncbi:2-dehydropantoate 2-reductase N-terminal domain-containing protein [Natrinema sp. CBA1119]|uniref:2-dehydropantoate 2-reductase N-terminal domain-containing protein n=1 Tax=Natrinema sp. CBA1119 TaxID=1608465 RepID=UPI00159B9AD3